MKVYIYNEYLDEPEGFYFSFNKEQLIKKLKDEWWDVLNEVEIEEAISNIQEQDIEFPESRYIIADYDEWNAEYLLCKYVSNLEELTKIDFTQYYNPEIHKIDDEGNIDNQPFIFIQ